MFEILKSCQMHFQFSQVLKLFVVFAVWQGFINFGSQLFCSSGGCDDPPVKVTCAEYRGSQMVEACML